MSTNKKLQLDDLRIRVKWLMLMRVVLVTFLAGTTILITLKSPQPELVLSMRHLYGLIVFAYLLTAGSAFFLKYVKRVIGFSYVQIAGDILFITGILQITGGIESPFVFLYFLSIISGSILRYQKGSLVATLLSAVSYMVLFYGNRAGWTLTSLASSMADPPAELYYRAFLNVFSFFIIAFLSNQLARRLKMAGEEIRQQTHSIEDLKVLNENIIQSVTSGLITTDLDGAITSMNRSAEKILGINKEETLQSDIGVLFPYSEVKEYIKNPGGQGDEFSRFEASFTTQTADTIVLGMTLSLLCDTGGNQRGLLCTFQDLTHFKALEEKMKHNEQLAMIGELSAGIAHEIRNPLASMSGSIQILKAELELDEENKRLMEIILKETDRLNTLIGNFLMYARPRALDCQPVCLNDLIEETVTLLKNGNRMNPSIQIVLEMDEEAQAMADSMAIRQVVWNLATNAIDAMPQGGTLRLDVSREEMGNGPHGGVAEKVVRLTVSDTGGGIDPNIGDKLFFPFLTTKEGGSGLGLAIVHQIVQQHGGWLDVVNDAGQGAAFHLYLPEAAHLVAS